MKKSNKDMETIMKRIIERIEENELTESGKIAIL